MAPARERLPEMERVGIYRVDEAIPLRRETERRARRTQVVSQGEEAPELLTGYLGPFGRGRVLTPEEELHLGPRARPGTRARTRLIAASTASGYASPSTTQSGDSEDDSCRNGAVEIRPGKGSATNGGTCYEGLTTQGI